MDLFRVSYIISRTLGDRIANYAHESANYEHLRFFLCVFPDNFPRVVEGRMAPFRYQTLLPARVRLEPPALQVVFFLQIITTGCAGGMHQPPWGMPTAEPIGSSKSLPTAQLSRAAPKGAFVYLPSVIG